MEGELKIVDFSRWCNICKHRDKLSNEDPCNECLTISARVDSRKPENWEGVNNDKKDRPLH